MHHLHTHNCVYTVTTFTTSADVIIILLSGSVTGGVLTLVLDVRLDLFAGRLLVLALVARGVFALDRFVRGVLDLDRSVRLRGALALERDFRLR